MFNYSPEPEDIVLVGGVATSIAAIFSGAVSLTSFAAGDVNTGVYTGAISLANYVLGQESFKAIGVMDRFRE